MPRLWQALLLVTVVVSWFSLVCCQQSRESFDDVACEIGRPADCTPEPPANCPDHKLQRWLPQSNIGVPAACGACYYCKLRPTLVERESCPVQLCPVISPLCNEIKPVIIEHGGRKCRGCSECVSYNTCPTPKCRKRIRGCEVYAPNYKYINGELCPDCRVCSRYKGDRRRPPATPLPCPKFNISTCPLVEKCEEYEERYLYMGEGRECQVCPKCLVWSDPNEDIPSYTLDSQGSAEEIVNCNDRQCTVPSNCAATEVVYRLRNGSTCRDCDRCTELTGERNQIDGGSDQPTPAPAPQTCPDLSRCPDLACDGDTVNKTIRIVTNEVCNSCAVCAGRVSDCPIIRCPGAGCSQTAMFLRSINGSLCVSCVCTDVDQDCSALTCPQTDCTDTVSGSVIIGDKICDCPVCRDPSSRGGVDAGADLAGPDRRNEVETAASSTLPNVVIATSTTTTAAPSTTPSIPNCETIVMGMVCPTVDCVIVNVDVLHVNEEQCYGCPRCASDLTVSKSCPTIQCDDINCGDNEDIALGRRYRETKYYNISGQMCGGCDECLDCPLLTCDALHPQCARYTRRTDSRGCVLCPYCEIWMSNEGPPIIGRPGFIQSVFASLCMESRGTFSDTEPGLIAELCDYDEEEIDRQKQVWTLSDSGLIQDRNTGLCVSYYSEGRPLVMRLCNVANANMIWSMQKDNTYPQFFRVEHEKTGMCLHLSQEGVEASPIILSTCQPFGRLDGVWSKQWWQFEEFLDSGVIITT